MKSEHNEDNFLYRVPRRIRKANDYGYAVYNEFPVSYRPSSGGEYTIYLFGPIEASEQFISAIEVFNHAGADDVVHVHLSSPGGSMDATDTFLAAMHQCEGRVIIHATGGCHSCGSIILMNATEFTLSENFNSLVHNGSTGGGGDLNKFAAAAKYSVEHMQRVLRTTYEGFLTPDELDAMLDGKDFWMNGPQFMERWNKREEYFRSKMEAKQALAFAMAEPIEVTPRPPARRKRKVAEV